MKIKKSMSLVLALIMLIGIAASTNVFAEGFESKVISNLRVEKGLFKSRITGTVNLRDTIINNVIKNEDSSYNGILTGEVEAGDLFSGAYKLYKDEFKGKKDFRGKYWENIVMMGENSEFPTAQYTFNFPKNFKINKDEIKVSENSEAISKIDYNFNENDNSVKVIIQLGNWNDYKGFFELVEKELEEEGHLISISIPYTVNTDANETEEIGNITGSGNCYLYKYSGLGKGRIVEINTENEPLIIRK